MNLTELLEAGNYTQVAMEGGPDDWQTYAALGLVGNTDKALAGLERFDGTEVSFYRAVASWIGGDDERATIELEGIQTQHARNLLSLIRKPRIEVLAQLPWTRRAPHDLLGAAASDEKFFIHNIGFHPTDLQNEPYADIQGYYDPESPPDFYICNMVEWHLIPPNLQKIPCPIIGHTSDYDLHIQALQPWLGLFDQLLVNDSCEWRDVQQIANVPVATIPKCFGVSDTLPPIGNVRKQLDVFLSGTMAHPYNPDKMDIIHQLLRMEDLKLKIVNGFIQQSEYYDTLRKTRLTLSYLRRSGGTPTRGLEALSMGCALLVQKGSVVCLFAGESEGVLTYDFATDDIAKLVRKVLDNQDYYEQCALRGAGVIRHEFSMARVASQYLRTLTYLAAKPRQPRVMQPTLRLEQKRCVLQKGWLPASAKALQLLMERMLQRNELRLKGYTSVNAFISILREVTLYFTGRSQWVVVMFSDERLLKDIFQLCLQALPVFENSLVLKFNLTRAILHLGSGQDVARMLVILADALRKPTSFWEVDAMEDVLPYDFASSFFNYRRYFDLVTENLVNGTRVESELISLMLASMHFYIGFYTEDISHFSRAVLLDGEFAYYKFEYAKRLVNRGSDGDYELAGRLLTELAEKSIVYIEAYDLLVYLSNGNLYHSPKMEELNRVIDNSVRSISLMQNEVLAMPLRPVQVVGLD